MRVMGEEEEVRTEEEREERWEKEEEGEGGEEGEWEEEEEEEVDDEGADVEVADAVADGNKVVAAEVEVVTDMVARSCCEAKELPSSSSSSSSSAPLSTLPWPTRPSLLLLLFLSFPLLSLLLPLLLFPTMSLLSLDLFVVMPLLFIDDPTDPAAPDDVADDVDADEDDADVAPEGAASERCLESSLRLSSRPLISLGTCSWTPSEEEKRNSSLACDRAKC